MKELLQMDADGEEREREMKTKHPTELSRRRRVFLSQFELLKIGLKKFDDFTIQIMFFFLITKKKILF